MRGQAHTLEAFMAALLLVASVFFALQATAVTPLSSSTSNQHIQNQLAKVANDLLATAAANGSLRDAVVFWNTSEGEFVGSGDSGYYTAGGPPIPFGEALNETFRDRQVAFNVLVRYWTESGPENVRMVYMGSPSDNAVSATRTVVLFNETRLSGGDESTLEAVVEATGKSFYAPDIEPTGELYNVVEVRIVVWRM